MLLLMCLFLYRIIRLIYLDFYSSSSPSLSVAKQKSGRLLVQSRGFLVADQTEFPIGETLNIGRSEGNDIIINETTVSYEHACISYYCDKYLLSDLESTNGILHNDVRLQEDTVLHQGDRIQIGSTIFQFEE
jgi:pSer/pThr/pTyr-binding forkhead associated (FHA) protein